MKDVTSILVCMHPEKPDYDLADQAAEIAKNAGAPVKVLHVVSEYPQDMSEWWNVRNPQKLHDQIVSEREAFLEAIEDRMRLRGVKQVSHELKWGKVFIEIIKEVLANKHDLVMITAGRKSKLGRMVLECPTMDLMQHCPCTLWVSKGKALKKNKRVVAALGGKAGRFECGLFNAKILSKAAAMAEAMGSELHVVFALPLYGGKGLKGKKLRPGLEGFVDDLRGQIMEQCSGALSGHQVTLEGERVHLLTGAPEAVIPEFVSKDCSDLIVMGSVTRSGVPRLFLGGTAIRVFDQVACSVVAVKPDDFVSLVESEERGRRGQEDSRKERPSAATKAGPRPVSVEETANFEDLQATQKVGREQE